MVLITQEEFTEFRVGNFETSSLVELEGKVVNLGEHLRTKTWSRNKQNQEGEAGMVMRGVCRCRFALLIGHKTMVKKKKKKNSCTN